MMSQQPARLSPLRTAVLILLILGATTIASSVRAEDIRGSYVHFIMTNGRPVALEFDRLDGLVAALYGEVEPAYILIRADLFGLGGSDPLSQLLGSGGFRTPPLGGKNWPVVLDYGMSVFDVNLSPRAEEEEGDKATEQSEHLSLFSGGRAQLGATIGYQRWVKVRAEFSVIQFKIEDNRATEDGRPITEGDQKGASEWAMDETFVEIRSPKLGPYALLRMDTRNGQPRDFEIGYYRRLKGKREGVLRLAFQRRYPYKVTGYFRKDGFDEDEKYESTGDYTGIAEWKYVKIAKNLRLSTGLAFGSSENPMRYFFGELQLQTHKRGWIYLRAGNAYNRFGPQLDRLLGWSVGFEGGVLDKAVFRTGLVVADYDYIDRFGPLGDGGVTLFMSATAVLF